MNIEKLEQDLNEFSLQFPELSKFFDLWIKGKLTRCEVCHRLVETVKQSLDDLKVCEECYLRAEKVCDEGK